MSPNLLENNGMKRIVPTEGRPLAVRWRYTGCPLAYTWAPAGGFLQPLQVAAARPPGSFNFKSLPARALGFRFSRPGLRSGLFHGRSRESPRPRHMIFHA